MAAAGNPDITKQLLKGVKLGDRDYKNHLDGYNQLDLLEGNGPSKRHELFYFAGPHLGALRLDDMKFVFFQQPSGWTGPKITTDMPYLYNIRQDPFERFAMIDGQTPANGAFGYGNDFYAREFWRFVMVQEKVADLAKTAIDYPPMQDPASFNLERREEADRGHDQGPRRRVVSSAQTLQPYAAPAARRCVIHVSEPLVSRNSTGTDPVTGNPGTNHSFLAERMFP